MSRTIPYLSTWSRTIPHLNTLNRIIPYLNTKRKNSNLTQNQILVGSQSESSTKKTLKPRQPIRIEYHSAETYPILLHCRNIPFFNTWVGDPSRSWARVGCYSLSQYMEGPPPPHPFDQLTLLLLILKRAILINLQLLYPIWFRKWKLAVVLCL